MRVWSSFGKQCCMIPIVVVAADVLKAFHWFLNFCRALFKYTKRLRMQRPRHPSMVVREVIVVPVYDADNRFG